MKSYVENFINRKQEILRKDLTESIFKINKNAHKLYLNNFGKMFIVQKYLEPIEDDSKIMRAMYCYTNEERENIYTSLAPHYFELTYIGRL